MKSKMEHLNVSQLVLLELEKMNNHKPALNAEKTVKFAIQLPIHKKENNGNQNYAINALQALTYTITSPVLRLAPKEHLQMKSLDGVSNAIATAELVVQDLNVLHVMDMSQCSS